MEKRQPRQRLQRLVIVPPLPAEEPEVMVVVELDAGTLRRFDALVDRVRASDVPPEFARRIRSLLAGTKENCDEPDPDARRGGRQG